MRARMMAKPRARPSGRSPDGDIRPIPLYSVGSIRCGSSSYRPAPVASATASLIACTMLAGRAMAPMAQLVALLMQYQNARLALKSLEFRLHNGKLVELYWDQDAKKWSKRVWHRCA